MDKILMLLDGLWFAGLLSNKQRKDATHSLRRMVYGLGRSIIDLERRARESARRAGKDAELLAADDAVNALTLATGSLVEADEEDEDEASRQDDDGGDAAEDSQREAFETDPQT